MSKVLGSRYGDESYFREGAELRQVPNKRLIADWAIRSEEEVVAGVQGGRCIASAGGIRTGPTEDLGLKGEKELPPCITCWL